METYIIKVNLCMALVYLIYRLALRSNDNPQSNRLVLLFGAICALIVPQIHLEMGTATYSAESVVVMVESGITPVQPEPSVALPSWSIYEILYSIGVLFVSFRCISGLATLLYFYWTSPKVKKWGFRVVEVNKRISPCTFFNLLFIHPDMEHAHGIRMILAHEEVHKKQWHSMDTLLLESMTILTWFNPFVWLLKKELRLTHEYLADEQVMKSGFGLLAYQQLLFSMCVGSPASLVNQFSCRSNLEKRFKVMNHLKSIAKRNFVKTVIAIPLLAFIAMASSFSGVSEPDTLPVYKDGASKNMYKVLADNMQYPLSCRQKNIQGIVNVSFVINAKGKVEDIQAESQGLDLTLKDKDKSLVVNGYVREGVELPSASGPNEEMVNEVIRTFKLLGKFTPATEKGHPVAYRMSLQVLFKIS